MKPVAVLSDSERFPLLSDLSFLKELRQDKCAPKYNFGSGDRLTAEKLLKVQAYGETMRTQNFWPADGLPDWLPKYLAWCRATVPAYRGYAASLSMAPSICRADIANTPWRFVSDESPVDDMLVYNTSGSTGAPMDVLFDPVSQATWLVQLESILAADGICLEGGPGRVSICLVCNQESTLTYASLSTYLRGAGILKINLNPDDWNSPDDRNRYLEKYDPEVLTGDPFTFLALADLAPVIRPKALVSSAMALSAGLRSRLEKQFGCPVYDIYSLTECRMIAVSKETGIYRLIRPELYVEILQAGADMPVAAGARGEITVTGGINPFLALIRYRTGDYGSLCHSANAVELCDFAGREPTVFLAADGRFVNNVDLSRALAEFALAGFTLHQRKDRSLEFNGWGGSVTETDIARVLTALFGSMASCCIKMHATCSPENKKVRYSSEFREEDTCL